MSALARPLRQRLHRYEMDAFCEAASLRDNLLFGRVVQRIAGAGRKIDQVLAQALVDLGLMRDVYRTALALPAGAGGRLLDSQQKSILSIARVLLKRPSALVVNLDFDSLAPHRRAGLLDCLRREMEGKTLILVSGDPRAVADFDVRVHFAGARLKTVEQGPVMSELPALSAAG